jgi:biopolymer transport protein ExbB
MNRLMINFYEIVELGGIVMWPLFAVCLVMWTLILERFAYHWFVHRHVVNETLDAWRARRDKTSWTASKIRQLWISQVAAKARGGTDLIATLVAVCPLLGLLGTVLGMLEVFHAIAVSGGGNVRAMAAGVSEATVSTMAGLIAALSGMFFGIRLTRRSDQERRRIDDLLVGE